MHAKLNVFEENDLLGRRILLVEMMLFAIWKQIIASTLDKHYLKSVIVCS